MKPLPVLCFAVLCITFTLGLSPFHAPDNEVTWLKGGNGIAFGRHGTVLSKGPLKTENSIASMEIWAQPKRWTGSTLLTLYQPGQQLAFELRQSLEDLEPSFMGLGRASHFYVDDALGPALREKKPVLITLTFGARGATVYRDGALARAAPGFRVPGSVFAGWLIVGDSIGETHSFRGDMLGLAIYDRELDASEVSAHYQSWTSNRRPEAARDASQTALYLFDERTGNAIHNRASPNGDLFIPRKYSVVDQIFLRPLWEEFDFSRSYWEGNLKNIVGLIPTGFCFYAYFISAWQAKRALLVTVILGFLVSLTIEVLQAYLPTRDSGTTDLITNTLGTYIGVLCYRRFSPLLSKFGFLTPLTDL